jgi:hypothetical protein
VAVVELAETEILAAHHQVGMHQEVAVARAAQQVELLVVWALIQISLEQHLCMGSGGAGSSTNTGSASSGGGSNGSPPIANRGGGGSQITSSVAHQVLALRES